MLSISFTNTWSISHISITLYDGLFNKMISLINTFYESKIKQKHLFFHSKGSKLRLILLRLVLNAPKNRLYLVN